MPKGEDAIKRKKNKANRKKMQSDPSTVSNRIAAIIAQKKRRVSGKRRQCQGMCFSLPTPENPFNDKHVNVDSKRKEKTKKNSKVGFPKANRKLSKDCKDTVPLKRTHGRSHSEVDYQERKRLRIEDEHEQESLSTSTESVGKNDSMTLGKAKVHLSEKHGASHDQQEHDIEDVGCPSKFLMLCLKTIQNALRHDEAFTSEEDLPFFVNTWGIEFWKCFSIGRNISETSGAYSDVQQIAWMVSTAADTISRKEKEGVLFTSPFLLFLVPSQEKAIEVRSVCKPLKALGVHTVSLHPGASLNHQIHGLKTCEPEFLVSTPARLLELISLKAVDISEISFLIVDGLESSEEGGDYLDDIKSIRQHISGDPHTVVFSDYLEDSAIGSDLLGSAPPVSFSKLMTN